MLAVLASYALAVPRSLELHLTINGQQRVVRTTAATVAGTLNADGYRIDPADAITPAPTTTVRDAMEIVVVSARPVTLRVDRHAPLTRMLPVQTVADALATLHVDTPGAVVTPAPATSVPLNGSAIDVSTAKQVTLTVGGRTRITSTTADTVGSLLADEQITLGPRDVLLPGASTTVTPGLAVRVVRVRVTTRTVRVPIAAGTVIRQDPNTDLGTRHVIAGGVPGIRAVVTTVVTTDGVARTTVSTRVLRAPVVSVVSEGSAPIAPVASSSPFSAPDEAAGVAAPASSVAGLNWAALAACESSGDPAAVDPSGVYFGLYQFDVGTWAAMGGHGLPSSASPAEQTQRAQLLYSLRGRSPWPVCGARL